MSEIAMGLCIGLVCFSFAFCRAGGSYEEGQRARARAEVHAACLARFSVTECNNIKLKE